MIIPTPQSFLLYLCNSEAARNEHNSSMGSKEMSNRAKFICEILELFGIEYKIHQFKDVYSHHDDLYFYNIEVCMKAKEETNEGVVFVAHHDILNIRSDNCQDNSASVINLIDLCNRLKGRSLDRNVFAVFTDSEEIAQRGASELAIGINSGEYGDIKYVVNSELTGKGSLIWGENNLPESDLSIKADELGVQKRTCPLNDSYALRDMGIESLCFGLILESEREQINPNTWKICHSKHDSFDIADLSDMNQYVEFLMKLI